MPPDAQPIGIEACGRSGSRASIDFYLQHNVRSIPTRGPLAANTVAGTVSGWIKALALARDHGGSMPMPRLLEDAIGYARDGIPVTRSQHLATKAKLAEFGVIALAFAPLGHRDLATAKGPVISPGDVRGLRVRVLALPFLSELYVALGAAPRTLGFAEAQAAFAAGELDAQEASAPSLESARVVAIGQKDVIRWGGTGEALVIAVRRAV